MARESRYTEELWTEDGSQLLGTRMISEDQRGFRECGYADSQIITITETMKIMRGHCESHILASSLKPVKLKSIIYGSTSHDPIKPLYLS